MGKLQFKLGLSLALFVLLSIFSITFGVQLNSENLFDYCEYYKFDGVVYEDNILCDAKGITSINPGTFEGYNNVKSLHIWSNNIETLESNTFIGLDNLESLTLSNNQIRNIEVGVFNGLQNLKQLDISLNQISTLGNGLFNGLNLLEELRLLSNKINNLERGIFSGLPNLTSLNLSENLIDNIKDGTFLGLNSLKLLDIGHNAIMNINDETFYNLNNLSNLTISMNCLDASEVSKIENRYPNSDNLIVYNFEQGVCYVTEITPNKNNGYTDGPVTAKLYLTGNESIVDEQSHYLNDVPDLIFTENGTKTFIKIPAISYSRNRPAAVTVDWINKRTVTTENEAGDNISDTGNVENNGEKTEGKREEKQKEDNQNTFTYDYSKFNSNYSDEMNKAYQYAYKYGITTINKIEKANMMGGLTRIAMAKMLSNYAINVLGKDLDRSKRCYFDDVSSNLDYQYDNGVTNACQLGIMGVGIRNFRPYDSVTRAEFGTALSRLLFDISDGKGAYYEPHLRKLMQENIITVNNPKIKEKRGYVMLMLMRSAN